MVVNNATMNDNILWTQILYSLCHQGRTASYEIYKTGLTCFLLPLNESDIININTVLNTTLNAIYLFVVYLTTLQIIQASI